MATTITANGINFPDGSASAPSIGGTDTNTGLFTGSDLVGFATGGNERLRITSDGKIGIATTSPDRKLEVQNDNGYAAKFGGAGGGSDFAIEIGQRGNNGSPGFNAVAGSMVFEIAGSEKGRFNESTGNFGINNNSPDRKLEVQNDSDYAAKFSGGSGAGHTSIEIGQTALNGSAGFNATGGSMLFDIAGHEKMRLDASGRLLLGTVTAGDSTADDLTIANSAVCGITIRSGTSSEGNIFFADGTSGDSRYRGMLRYDHNVDAMILKVTGGERLRINSVGQVLIGTSSNPAFTNRRLTVATSSGTTAIEIRSAEAGDGRIIFTDSTSSGSPGSYKGQILYDQSNDYMSFNTNGNNERLRIKSDGETNIGTGSVNIVKFCRSGNKHQIVGQAADGVAALDVYSQHGSSAAKISFAVSDNRTGSKKNTFVVRGDGSLILDSTNNGYGGLKIYDDSAGDYNVRYVAGRNQSATSHVFMRSGRTQNQSPWADATAAEHARITRGGIAFGGDTAEVNTLQDYEEGTWTPNLKSNNSTVSWQSGESRTGVYTKIGRMVYAQFAMHGTLSQAYSSHNQVLSGLPHTSAATNQVGVGLVQDVSGVSYPGGYGDIYGRVNASVTECQLLTKKTDGSTHAGNPNFSSGAFVLRGMVIYNV